MTEGIPFAGDPADSQEAIMWATFQALQEHGYAGLSIQRIADESDLSKSTFYHHFDGKEDLLLSFVDFMLTEFTRIFQLESTGDPAADLRTYISLLLGDFPNLPNAPANDEILATYMELRAQAIRDPEFREKFTETAEGFSAQLAGLIETGVEQGVFADVDPEQSAKFLLTIVDGIILQNTTRNDDPVPLLRDAIEQYIEHEILADDAA